MLYEFRKGCSTQYAVINLLQKCKKKILDESDGIAETLLKCWLIMLIYQKPEAATGGSL